MKYLLLNHYDPSDIPIIREDGKGYFPKMQKCFIHCRWFQRRCENVF